MKDKRLLILAAIVASVTIILLLAYWIYLNFHIVSEGQILPYTDHYIYQVMVGNVKFYVEPEMKLSDDIINSVIILGVSYISMTFAAILIDKGKSSRHVISFFVLISAGTFFLAADESFGIHESIGHNMQFLMKIPGIHYPDDFIVMMYGVILIFFLFYFRSVYLGRRRPLIYFGITVGLFFGVAISEIVDFPLEEVVEIALAISLLFGATSLGLSILNDVDNAPPDRDASRA